MKVKPFIISCLNGKHEVLTISIILKKCNTSFVLAQILICLLKLWFSGNIFNVNDDKKGYIKGWTVCILRRGWGGRVEHHEFFTSSLAFSNTIGAWKNAQQCLLCVHIFPPLDVEKYFSASRRGKICTHSKGHAACIFAQLWRKTSLQLRNIRKNVENTLSYYIGGKYHCFSLTLRNQYFRMMKDFEDGRGRWNMIPVSPLKPESNEQNMSVKSGIISVYNHWIK